MRPIFCGNFEFDAHQSDLERLFKRYGKVDRVEMKSGFAFVYMDDDRDAEDAIRGLDRKEFGRKGRRLRVEWTKHERGVKKQVSSRRSANVRPSKTLFVINFPYETRTRDLERHFETYGKLVNVRIRRNFAFVQYEFQEDATKALDATNMSKMLDRVISVEYAVRDDDDSRRNGSSPDGRRGGGRDRSPDRRRRSPSPYARERGSPDYGRGSSPALHRRERASPDYGNRPRATPSPRRVERRSPDYHRERSRSPLRRKHSPDYARALSPSPRRRERDSADYPRERERSHSLQREKASPEHRRTTPDKGQILSPNLDEERASLENGQVRSPSPNALPIDQSPPRDRTSPQVVEIASDNCRDISLSPQPEVVVANGNGADRRSSSPFPREEGSPDIDRGSSPIEKLERSPVEEY